ncbi:MULTISPECIES: DsbA family oxidoreductase [Eubacteriales]|uniref:DsbA family oxidoreductase n=1 Tax=Eubacteriales TaxID=186802 RepID=UPI00028B4456|nr:MULTISPECIES: DsbA family oxidoreductase [Eubacteriales]AFV04066.1 2-hydroxychromene-2-carboxylate isomerase/DsbA-like thioredoxin domain protein [Dehalobacter sp. CF]MDJ0304849.1 DsbA family oxidoreductase [Dehalobacter sp.]
MKIEIWSDYVCPFCYIGERKLGQALEQLKMTDDVEIIFKSFELDPNAQKQYEGDIHQLMAKKYGISIERAIETNNNIVRSAREVGLVFNFDDLKRTNTFDAHRLSYYAKEKGRLSAFTEAVMRSYFIEALDISNLETLLDLAVEVGLDREKAKGILTSSAYSQEVRTAEQNAHSKGINGVPYFIFDEKEVIYGAQPVEAFVNVIEAVKNNVPTTINETNF